MKKKRILHIFNKMDRGGAELRTIDLLRHLDHDRYEFYFCSLSGEKGELDEVIRNLGGTIIYCKLKDINFIRKFTLIIKKNKINVIHSNMYYFSGIILFLAKCAKVSVRIAHFRTVDSGKPKSLFNSLKYKIFKGLIKRYATLIIGVSKSALTNSLGSQILKDKRVKVLYNGIDLRGLNQTIEIGIPQEENLRIKYNLMENDKVFIHIGRMTEAKNHLKLIEIFNEYLKSNKEAFLFIIGKRDEAIDQKLSSKIKDYSIEDKVFFLGIKPNVFLYLKQADCMIYPSIREGLPGAILEAMASGVPVIASNISPHIELSVFFNSIKCVSINVAAKEWVFEIEKLIKNNNFDFNEKIASDFLNSPFTISNYTTNYLKLIEK